MQVPEDLQQLWDDYHLIGKKGRLSRTDDDELSLRYFAAEQDLLAGVPTRERSVRIIEWLMNLHSVEAWIEENDDLPRQVKRKGVVTNEKLQRHLSVWIDTQRRALEGTRCTYQLRRMGCVKYYNVLSDDERWTLDYEAYKRFIVTHDVPRYRSEDPEETRLANWAAQQRFKYRRVGLPPERVRRLESLRLWGWGLTSHRRVVDSESVDVEQGD
jgi:hypothetical protein